MWEMAQVFQKRLKYVGNDVEVFQKRLKCVGNDIDLWEMAQICREMT